MNHPDGATVLYSNASCEPIVTIADAAGGNVPGNTTASLKVDATVGNYNGQPYLQRHLDITPASNGPATVTLYFLQSEFNAFNTAAVSLGYPYLLPTSPSDPALSNLSVTAFHAAGSGGPGGVYDPASAQLISNAQLTATYNGNYWAVVFPVSGFSGFFLSAGNSTPLAIRLNQFAATKDGNRNRLNWSTATEETGDYVMVEHSADGSAFQSMGRVNATGKPNSSYAFYDESPGAGKNYYRLRFAGVGGAVQLSKTVVVNNSGLANALSVYPNPAGDRLQLLMNDAPALISICITDVLGQTHLTQQMALSTNNSIDISGLYRAFIY